MDTSRSNPLNQQHQQLQWISPTPNNLERFSSAFTYWSKVSNSAGDASPGQMPPPGASNGHAHQSGLRQRTPATQQNASDLIFIQQQQPILGEHLLRIMLNGPASMGSRLPTIFGNYQIKDVIMSLWRDVDASENDFYSKFERYSPATDSLHREIVQFYEYMKPSQAERLVRKRAIDRISAVIIKKLEGVEKVSCFGSYKTELCLPTSDIDLVVFGQWIAPPLNDLKNILIDSGVADEHNTKALDRASVPILKLTDSQTGIRFDISFNMINGTRSIGIIKEFLAEFPPLRYLVLVLKHFLLQRCLNEVFTGGIGSYLLTMMTVSFLQLHSQMNCRIQSRCNLGRLLVDFFELYGRTFNYQRMGIRVTEGGSYVPKDKLISQFSAAYRGASMLAVEDPLDQLNDIGRGSYSTANVRAHFCSAFQILERCVHLIDSGLLKFNTSSAISVLGSIIGVNNRIVEYRKYIDAMFKKTLVGDRLSDSTELTCDSASRGNSQSSCNSPRSVKDADSLDSETEGLGDTMNGRSRKDRYYSGETSNPSTNDSLRNSISPEDIPLTSCAENGPSPSEGSSSEKSYNPMYELSHQLKPHPLNHGVWNGDISKQMYNISSPTIRHNKHWSRYHQPLMYFRYNYPLIPQPPLAAIANKLPYNQQPRPLSNSGSADRFYYQRNNSLRPGTFPSSRQFRNSGLGGNVNRRFYNNRNVPSHQFRYNPNNVDPSPNPTWRIYNNGCSASEGGDK